MLSAHKGGGAGAGTRVQVLPGRASAAERVGVMRRDRLARASGIYKFLTSLRRRPFCAFWATTDVAQTAPGKNGRRARMDGNRIECERVEADVVDDGGRGGRVPVCFWHLGGWAPHWAESEWNQGGHDTKNKLP